MPVLHLSKVKPLELQYQRLDYKGLYDAVFLAGRRLCHKCPHFVSFPIVANGNN